MLELLEQRVSGLIRKEEKYNLLREYLQLLILKIIDEQGFFRNMAFVGGTALRILYDLRRFSEDLDFSLVDDSRYHFAEIMDQLTKSFALENIGVSIRYKDRKTVASAFIKFENLLFRLGLSPHRDERINVKFEIDQNPPGGYKTQFTMVNKAFLIGVNHYDLPSLFAGKLHAVLCRKYSKGRDFYDLVWYLAKKVQPNYDMLEEAILQTEHVKIRIDKAKLIDMLTKKIQEVDINQLHADVAPFLENAAEMGYLERNKLIAVVTTLNDID